MTEPDDRSTGEASPAQLIAALARSYRTWLVVVAVAVLGLVWLLWGANRPADPKLGDATGEAATITPSTPADGLAFEERLQGVGEHCLLVLVADSQAERASGLRYRETELRRVDGMLFVDTPGQTAAFTMAGVVAPLDLGFYDEQGDPVGRHAMAPCPGSEQACPIYRPQSPWTFALETAPGRLPDGPLRRCSSRTGP